MKRKYILQRRHGQRDWEDVAEFSRLSLAIIGKKFWRESGDTVRIVVEEDVDA